MDLLINLPSEIDAIVKEREKEEKESSKKEENAAGNKKPEGGKKISSELIEENQLYSKVYLTSLIVISCRFYLNQYLNSIINWYSLHEKSTKLLNNIFHVHTSGAFY